MTVDTFCCETSRLLACDAVLQSMEGSYWKKRTNNSGNLWMHMKLEANGFFFFKLGLGWKSWYDHFVFLFFVLVLFFAKNILY